MGALATVEEINSGLKKASENLVNLLDKLDNEKNPTEPQLKAWNEERVGLEGEMKTLNTQLEERKNRDEARRTAEGYLAHLRQPANPMRHDGNPGGGIKSLTDHFLNSDGFKSWRQMVAPAGVMPQSKSGGRLPDSGPVSVEGGLKTLLVGGTSWAVPSDTSANALVQPEHRGLVDSGLWRIPLGILDFVGRESTASEIIYYARSTAGTAAAAATAEATASGGSSGAKPEGGLTFEVKQAIVRTIPVWVPATRQALQDASQLRTIIDEYLRYEVMRELSEQIISGDGSGENFTGVNNLTNNLDQAFATDRLVTARKARTKLLLEGRVVPNAWAMHPTDWEAIDLLTDNENRYYFGGPESLGRPTLWGTPVTESEFVTVGHGMLADWTKARLADREMTTIRVSDSHADFFARNLIAILAEARAAFYVVREQAFCKTAWA